MQARVRIGVVGAGRWGRNLIRAFEALTACDVGAVCDTDERLLESLILPSGTRRFTDLAALLQADSVHAVAIATPAAVHAPQGIQALLAGKHVFVEKPMATSLREAHQLREAAIAAKRRLMVGHLLRYHPAILALRRLIEMGELGDIHRVVALRLGPRGPRADECPWWSLAPHDVSLVQYLLEADVTEVSAWQKGFADGSSEVTAHLGLTKGGTAELVASTSHPEKTRRLVVFGGTKSAVFDDRGPRSILTMTENPFGPPSDLPALRLASWEPPDSRDDSPTRVPFHPAEPLLCEALHFISAIREGGNIATDANEGCSVIAALEAGTLSMSRAGAKVRVSGQSPSASSARRLVTTGFA